MKTSVKSQVRRIASTVFAISEEAITDASSPDTIPTWDSLAHMNLVVALETELGIRFTIDELDELMTMELVEVIVKEKLGGNPPST